MPRLIGKLYDLVLDRGAVSRTHTFNFSGIQRRFCEVLADRVMYLSGRVADIAVDLFLFETVSGKRERHRCSVARLRFERAPIDCAPIQSRRSSGFQSTDREA